MGMGYKVDAPSNEKCSKSQDPKCNRQCLTRVIQRRCFEGNPTGFERDMEGGSLRGKELGGVGKIGALRTQFSTDRNETSWIC